jgi:hypothetical protein
MGQIVFGILVVIGFLWIGTTLIRDPRSFLTKFGRQGTDRHVRATRLIGVAFLIFVLMILVQWLHRAGVLAFQTR